MMRGRDRRARAAKVLRVVLACACARAGALQVPLDVPPDLADTWARLLAAAPLPAEVEVIPSTDALQRGDRIVLERRRSVTLTGELPTPAPGERVVDVVPMAPVGRLGEGPESIAGSELSHGVRVLALDQIELPEIALGVDGRWPGDEEWQLFEQVVIRIEGESDALRAWLSKVVPLASERPSWIAAVGTISLTRGVDAALLARGGTEHVLGDTLPVLRGTVLAAGRLDTPAARHDARPPKAAGPRFQPEALAALRAAGFTWLGLEGPAFQSDPAALRDTLDALSSTGLASAESQSGKSGVLVLDEPGMEALVSPPPPGVFLVAMAGGSPEPEGSSPEQRRGELHRLAGLGARLVIDSVPREVRGLEVWEGALIAHSLGTFLAPGADGLSAILRVGIWRGRIRCVRTIPLRLKAGTVRLDEDPAALERLYALTRELSSPP